MAISSNPLTEKPTDALIPSASLPKGSPQYMTDLLEASKQKAGLESLQDQIKAKQGQMLAEGTTGAIQKYAEEREPTELKQQLKQKTEELGAPFIPTQRTAGDLGLIFALTNIIGFAIGRGGKGPAQAALSAQNGMLEGWQKGDMDAYKKQKEIFEENQKALGKAVEGLRDELARAEKTASVNKELALAQTQEAIAKYGADTIGKYLESHPLSKAVDLLTNTANMYKQLEDKVIKQQELGIRLKELALSSQRLEAETKRLGKETFDYVTRNGKTYAINKNNPNDIRELDVDLSGAIKLGSSKGITSATNERLQNSVLRSAREVERSFPLIEQIGIQTGKGALGGVVGKGTMTSEVAGNIGRSLSSEEQLNYSTAIGGLALELAYVLNGGYKPNQAQIDDLNSIYSVSSQDTLGTAAYKFSDIVAKLKVALESSPSFSTEQEEKKSQLLNSLNKYATPEEVYERQYGISKREEPLVRSGKQSNIDPTTGYPKTNKNGWVLHSDGKGGYAYVSPDGKQFEELE